MRLACAYGHTRPWPDGWKHIQSFVATPQQFSKITVSLPTPHPSQDGDKTQGGPTSLGGPLP
jgi:hypothetical protein